MNPYPKNRRPRGRQLPTPARMAKAPNSAPGLALPHERDEAGNSTAPAPDAVIVQALHDIQSGQVDTDMRATPGLDAQRRARLVPGPGGLPPGRSG